MPRDIIVSMCVKEDFDGHFSRCDNSLAIMITVKRQMCR